MKLETFFEKFDQFADAPDAVAKMRELILQLAVQGTVVDPVDDDEPVGIFLGRIWADKSGSRTELLDVEKAQPFELPAHWRWVVLAEVAEFSIGKTPPRGDSSYWYPEDHSWVSIADMKNYGTITETKEKVSASAAQDVFRQRFVEPGSILMSFKLTIGKVARAGIRCFHNEAIISLQPPEPELADYLFRFLPIFAKLQTSNNAIKGSTLNKGLLTLLPIALPPLAEQKRIVAKVDELMALCDRLEAQQQERETRHAALARASLARFADAPTPANLPFLFHPSYAIPPADLRKSILTLAVQGKLVPQDPNDEPAEDLLARIARKRTDLLKAGYPNRDEASTQMRKQEAQVLPDDLEPLAPGWSWATLIQASLLVVDCHNKTAPYVQSGIRLLRTTNIRDGRLNLTEPKFVDDAIYERWSARCKPEPGDVLITREAPMGEVCIIPEGMKVCLGQRMMLIRLVPGTMDQKYLLYSLMAPDLMERVQDKPVGATVQHLRVGGVETLLTPVPPVAEQRRIVAKVEQLMALVDALETQLAASRATAANLLEAIVQELQETVTRPAPQILALGSCPILTLLAIRLAGAFSPTRKGGDRKRLVKSLAIVQRQLGIDFGWFDYQETAGPYNGELLEQIEHDAEALGLLKIEKRPWEGKTSYHYTVKPLPIDLAQRLAVHCGEKGSELNRIANIFTTWTSREAELYATIHAVWNDLIIEKLEANNAKIVEGVVGWSDEKREKFSRPEIGSAITYLRENRLAPWGFGPKTRAAQLSLFDPINDAD